MKTKQLIEAARRLSKLAGSRMFLNLDTELRKRGIQFRLVEARSSVREMLRIEGMEEKVGRIDRFTMLADAIDDFQKTPPSPAA
jgi:MFS superfamily sulfate permease-like transporter